MIPAAIAVGVLVPRDHASQIELDEAVERFRASTVPADSFSDEAAPTSDPASVPESTAPGDAAVSTGSADTPAPTVSPTTQAPPQPIALVESGVYVYETTGSEHIDALSGVTHEYPPETTITVIADGCGVLLRWDALKERREEWRLCATPSGIELQTRSLQYHEFFDQETPEDVICDEPVIVVPVDDSESAAAALTCTIVDRPWLPVWEVLESDVRVVDGKPLDVRHVRMTIDDNDDHYEHYVADWLLAPSGLPVELSVNKQSKSPSVVGDVVYDEVVQLTLVSAEPLR